MKVKHVLMIAAVLLSMLVMPVVAADEQEPATTRGSTLTYGVSSSYDVEIPETIEFNAGAYVTASDVIINDGAALVVTVDSGYGWKLQLSDENTNDVLNYQMFIGGSTSAAVDDAVVINIAHPATGDSVKLEFTTEDTAKKSGSYKDTLTFTIEVKEGAASEANSNILLINDLDELKTFRDDVNNGNSYEGWTIKLMDDIDLNNEEWTPIGFNKEEEAGNENYFAGTFDGQEYTIKNLKINKDNVGGVGLFGAVYNANFKNIILENVDIKVDDSDASNHISGSSGGKPNYIVGGHTGALVGYDANTGEISFENVHIKGLILIEGETDWKQGQRIGGIMGGKGQSKVSFKDVSVIGDEGSYIKGYCNVGGVVGQYQGTGTFENVHTDINVFAVNTGTDATAMAFGAGGIAGTACQGSTFTDCSANGNIHVDASSGNSVYRVGGITGSWSASTSSHTLTLDNCEFTGMLSNGITDSVTTWDYGQFVGRAFTYGDATIGSKVTINGVVYEQTDSSGGYTTSSSA